MTEPTEQEVERLITRLETGGRDVNMRSVQIEAADMLESLSSRLAAERKERWQPIETAPKQRKVIVAYKNALGKWRTVMAMYFPPDTLELEDEDGYAPEGWYESVESHETTLPTDAPPTHWMPLPSPPDAAIAESTK